MNIRQQIVRMRNWLAESARPNSANIGYQPKTIFTGGMYGSYISSLDSTLDLAQRLKKGSEEVIRKYGEDVGISIYLANTSQNKPIFRVDITELKRGTLEPALREFLTCAGKPSFVYDDFTFKSNAEKNLIAKVLKEETFPETC